MHGHNPSLLPPTNGRDVKKKMTRLRTTQTGHFHFDINARADVHVFVSKYFILLRAKKRKKRDKNLIIKC